MLFTIGIILLVLWLVGLITTYTFGGFIYVALVIGVILLVIGFIQRARTNH
ncbi:lmo0937 family membrane protein [uncultured Sphaerochaeta sp.]|uniref:lmo0937 family membrane protein n=1 Tax=uncultured Sphaerochaeta sp. TaxID=886478 RepID=UPI002A0A4678|nr:lmo0937 family membrane protein [uncultured Sphaerochaeta sp.]